MYILTRKATPVSVRPSTVSLKSSLAVIFWEQLHRRQRNRKQLDAWYSEKNMALPIP
jgi:hypothetical protein